MNLQTILGPEQFKAAWLEFSGKASPIVPSETDEAARIASREGIDFCEALDRVRGVVCG